MIHIFIQQRLEAQMLALPESAGYFWDELEAEQHLDKLRERFRLLLAEREQKLEEEQ